MQKIAAALLAVIIVIILIVVAAYAWYNYTGWTAFSSTTGDTPKWPAVGSDGKPPPSVNIARLRFKDVIFTVTRRDGVTQSYNVTPVLNGMAVAYEGAVHLPKFLTLTRPLNPFSFVIPGFNDSKTVKDPTTSLWCAAPPASCTADAQCGGAGNGVCSCSQDDSGVCPPNVTGTCAGCPGAAVATLKGYWRVI